MQFHVFQVMYISLATHLLIVIAFILSSLDRNLKKRQLTDGLSVLLTLFIYYFNENQIKLSAREPLK